VCVKKKGNRPGGENVRGNNSGGMCRGENVRIPGGDSGPAHAVWSPVRCVRRCRRRPLIAMLSTVGMCGVFFLFLFGLGSVFKKPNSVRNEFCLVRFKNRGFVRIL